jgi:hypothetical protein
VQRRITVEVLQTFAHNGRVLAVTAYEAEATPAPPRPSRRRAPGAGSFEIGEIGLASTDAVATLTARVAGESIAFIYSEILLKDPSVDRFYGPVAREHVQAACNRGAVGVGRPVWEADIRLDLKLNLRLRLLTDGADAAFCFAGPEAYGDSDYRLLGLYAAVAGAGPSRARLSFSESGELRHALGYREQGKRSLPRPLTPKRGDRFTPFVQVLSPTVQGEGWSVSRALATPLTFGEQGFRVVTSTLMPGEYLVGLSVEDLDGGSTRKYAPLTIGH